MHRFIDAALDYTVNLEFLAVAPDAAPTMV